MDRRWMIGIVLVMALTLVGAWHAVTASAAAAAEPLVLRLAHSYATTSARHLSAEKLGQMLEAATGGRVRIQIFPAGQLYTNEAQALQAVIQGNIELATPPLGNVTAFDPAFFVFDLPFLFKDQDTLNRFEDGPIGTALLKRFERIGLKGLSYWDAGAAVVATKRPVATLNDLKGLKLRVPAGKMQALSFRTFGASTVALGVGEIPSALQNGLIDGVYTDNLTVQASKLYEVAGHMLVTYQQFFTPGIVMNLKTYERLPPDIREILDKKVLPEWVTWQRALSRKLQSEVLDDLAKRGMTITRLDHTQTDAARAANREAYEEGRKAIGDELYSQVMSWR